MDMNNIFSYGSTAQVLIRVKSARVIDGVSYTDGEPYIFLDNITARFIYDGNNTEITKQGVKLAYKEDYPTHILITGVSLTSPIMSLIFNKQNNSSDITMVKHKEDFINGVALLETTAKDFFFYIDDIPSTNYTWNNTTKVFSINNYDNTKTYTLFYTSTISQKCFSLTAPHNAYFTLELYAVGNKTEDQLQVYIKLPSCQLEVDKSMEFRGYDGNVVDLSFAIIDNATNYIVFQ